MDKITNNQLNNYLVKIFVNLLKFCLDINQVQTMHLDLKRYKYNLFLEIILLLVVY